MHVGKQLTIMLAAKRSAGVAPEVKLREHISRMPPPSANKASHSGFETQRRHHQKSKTGVSVAPQKGLMSSKNLEKKKNGPSITHLHAINYDCALFSDILKSANIRVILVPSLNVST